MGEAWGDWDGRCGGGPAERRSLDEGAIGVVGEGSAGGEDEGAG